MEFKSLAASLGEVAYISNFQVFGYEVPHKELNINKPRTIVHHWRTWSYFKIKLRLNYALKAYHDFTLFYISFKIDS
jgi:hypothetical protein